MTREPTPRRLDLAVALFAGCALFAVLGDTAADPDLWGHVRFGQLMRGLGFVPAHDPYAYTEAGRTWINHEWLAEWLLGWAYDLAGSWGLVGIKLAFGAAVFGLAALHFRRRGVGTVLLAILLLLAALAMRIAFGTVRPQLFTSLLLLAVLLVLRESRLRPAVLWLLPPAFLLWVNVHGGVLAGLGIVGIWGVFDRIEAWRRGPDGARSVRTGPSAARWAVVGLLSAAALLVNPYGPDLPRFLLETATVPRPFIQEWAPLRLASPYGVVYLLLLVTGGLLVGLSDRPLRPPELAVVAVGALLPLLAVRHLAVFAVVWLVVVADPAAGVWALIRERREPSDRGIAGWLPGLAVAALLFGAVGLAVDGLRDLGCVKASGPETMEYPRETVRYLARTTGPLQLAVHFSWGEYAIWHLGPRIQVAIDGRRETVYPDSVYDGYLAFQTGRGDWSRHLRDPDADLALVQRAGPSANLLDLHPAWIRWMDGPVGALFARTAVAPSLSPVAADLDRGPEGGAGAGSPSCFPE